MPLKRGEGPESSKRRQVVDAERLNLTLAPLAENHKCGKSRRGVEIAVRAVDAAHSSLPYFMKSRFQYARMLVMRPASLTR